MKIVDKRKDYYDGVSYKYFDKDVIFLRKSEKKVFTPSNLLPKVGRDLRNGFWIYFDVVGFCGRLYPVISLKQRQIVELDQYLGHFYTANSLLDFADKNNFKIPDDKLYGWFKGERPYFSKSSIKDFFKKDYSALNSYFMALRVPYFLFSAAENISEIEVVTNPNLAELQFAKVVDPYSAHQEIFRYLTSVLPQPERPMVQISDKDKIHKHGFDKNSFRKGPSKRGKNESKTRKKA